MKLIIGLGNPGDKYTWTRHNAGRLLVETIARENVLSFADKKKLKASVVAFNWGGQSVVLAFPLTYMNHSGEAVRALCDYYSLEPSKDVLVAVDEVALPYGKLRFRPKGSAGGHNGLKSIEALLHTQDYGRLRLGIGPLGQESGEAPNLQLPLEKYVLAPFSKDEKEGLSRYLVQASQACLVWLQEPPEKTMNMVNSSSLE